MLFRSRLPAGLVLAAWALELGPFQKDLIDRFVTLHQAGDSAFLKLLAEQNPPGDQPIDDDTFERHAAGHYLRSNAATILEVRKGDVGPNGEPRLTRGRYTFVTRGSLVSPVVRIRTTSGGDAPAQLNVTHPDIVVEVRDGKVHPLRTEVHR